VLTDPNQPGAAFPPQGVIRVSNSLFRKILPATPVDSIFCRGNYPLRSRDATVMIFADDQRDQGREEQIGSS